MSDPEAESPQGIEEDVSKEMELGDGDEDEVDEMGDTGDADGGDPDQDDGGKEEEEESEEEEEPEERYEKPVHKKRKKRRTLADFVDEEVEVSSDEEVSDDEEDRDDEGEELDLIDDSEVVVRRKKRKKKRRRREEALAEGDIELLKEAGITYQRQIDEDVDQDDDGVQRKRIKKKRHLDDDDEEPAITFDEPVKVEEKESLETHLFGEDSDEDEVRPAPMAQAERVVEEDEQDFSAYGAGGHVNESVYRAKEIFGGDLGPLFQADLVSSDSDGDDEPEPDSQDDDSGMSGDEAVKKKPLTQAQIEAKILQMDVPERLQHRQTRRVQDPMDLDGAIEKEAEWISASAFGDRKNSIIVTKLIVNVLTFIRVENLEVPFVALYRREYLKEEDESLNEDDVWTVDHWDHKWVELERRRTKLEKMIEDMGLQDENLEHILRTASHGNELDDCQDYLRAVRLTEGREGSESKATIKRSEGRQFRLLQFVQGIHGIHELSDSLGITAREFGENLQANHQIYKPEDPSHDIREVAEDYITQLAPDKEAVLKFACDYTARRISLDVMARQTFRKILTDRALVSTTPTVKGVKEINWAHHYFEVKRMQNRPVHTFEGTTTFRLLKNAQKEGFIEYKIHFLNTTASESRQHAPSWFQQLDIAKQEEHIDILKQIQVSDFHSSELERFVLATAERVDNTFKRAEDDDVSTREHVEDLVQWFFNTSQDDLLAQFAHLYLNDLDQGEVAAAWDEQRLNTLRAAIGMLTEDTQKCIYERLLSEADEQIVKEGTKKFYELATAGKFTSPALEEDEMMQVLSIVVGDLESPTTCVLLTEYGDVVDHLTLDFMKSKVNARSTADGSKQLYDRKKKDTRKFQEFISHREPRLILIDTTSMDCFFFHADLVKSVLVEFPDIIVQFADPAVGIIFENSERGVKEFKDYSPLMRRAIGMGRMVLDPISELAALWYLDEESVKTKAFHNREVLSLDLHPLLSSIEDRNLLLRALERALVRMVNYVGVDLNKLAERMHLAHTLQFVCGLGEVKSKRLYATLNRRGFFASREEMSEDRPGGIFGPTIFRNTVGFLQLRRNYAMDESNKQVHVSPLDETRIHPETMEYTDQIVRSVLDSDDDDDDDDEEDDEDEEKREERRVKFSDKVEKVMESEKQADLDDLDLERFAEQENKDILDTLYLIRAELKDPFADNEDRIRPHSPPSGDHLFDLLTGETSAFLREGCKVFATVVRTNQNGATCKIEGGLTGFLEAGDVDMADLSEMHNKEDRARAIEEKFQAAKVIECRIKHIKKDRCEVTLSARARDVSNKVDLDHEQHIEKWRTDIKFTQFIFCGIHEDDRKILDPYGDDAKATFIERNIVHPLFLNVDRDGAIVHLEGKNQGEAVIRPSTKGIHFLSVTWKVAGEEDAVCFDFEIEEKEKVENDMLGLGRELRVGNEAYEDLDEVLARYLDPMVQFSNRIIENPKFRFGDEGDILEVLQGEAERPKHVPYTIWIDPSKPGMFRFSYLRKNKMKNVYFRLLSDGYRFQSHNYTSPSRLITKIKQFIMHRETSGRAPSGHHSSRHRSSRHGSGSSSRHSRSHRSHHERGHERSRHGHSSSRHRGRDYIKEEQRPKAEW